MTALASEPERPPHSSLRSASSWRTVLVSPLMTVVTSALALVSERQLPLDRLVLLLDLAVAFAALEAPASPACTCRIANDSMCDVKPAKRPIVPMTPINGHRRIGNFGMIMLHFAPEPCETGDRTRPPVSRAC
jgi:hypothetical protein